MPKLKPVTLDEDKKNVNAISSRELLEHVFKQTDKDISEHYDQIPNANFYDLVFLFNLVNTIDSDSLGWFDKKLLSKKNNLSDRMKAKKNGKNRTVISKSNRH